MKAVKITRTTVISGKLLGTNTEWEWIKTTTKRIYCGCGSSGYKNIDFYQVKFDTNTTLEVDSRVGILINSSVLNKISPEDQYSFGRGDQKAGRDYSAINSRPNIKDILDSVNNIPM